MCFSAPASFGASAALAAIGVVSLTGARTRGARVIAATPLIFAAQQAVEGALWIHLKGTPWGQSFTPLATLFLFFAVFVWPVFVPFALRGVETDPRRRRAMLVLGGLGLVLGGYLLAVVTFRPSGACIAGENLYYGVQVDAPLKPIAPFVYLAVVLLPMVISSARGARVMAVATAACFGAAALLFRVGFASVWCFFAALLSGAAALVARAASSTQRRALLGSPSCESS